MHDRGREYFVLRHQVTAESRGIDPVDLEIRDRTRLERVEGGIEPDLRDSLQIVHPVARQVTQAFLFPLAADRVVKENSFTDGKSHRGRVRADLFEFADVAAVLVFRGHKGPNLRDLLLLYV